MAYLVEQKIANYMVNGNSKTNLYGQPYLVFQMHRDTSTGVLFLREAVVSKAGKALKKFS